MENRFENEVDKVQLRNKEKNEIRFLAAMGSLSVTGYIVFSQIIGIAIGLLNIGPKIASHEAIYEAFSMIVTVICIGTPFFLAGFFEKKRTGITLCPFKKPKSALLMTLAVAAGAALCVVGSIVTGYISAFFASNGVTLTQPSLASPKSGIASAIYLIRLAVVPAFVEEICFRGIIMQPLRKYGNLFAVVMSSLLFALTHCNLIQAPAAFISGIGLGYLVIVTDTLWTSVLVHFINNLMVALSSYFYITGNNDLGLFFGSTIMDYVLIIGLICLAAIFVLRKTIRINTKDKPSLPSVLKTAIYLFNPSMIIMLLSVAFMMSYYIKR